MDPEATTVFVGNLPFQAKTKQISEFMSAAGTVVNVELLRSDGGLSKGCAIVEFSSPAEAQTAIATLHDVDFGGRLALVRVNAKPSFRRKYQLKVNNLPANVQWYDVKDMVREIAPVAHVDAQGGRAVVQLEFDGDVERVQSALDGKIVGSGDFEKTISCAVIGDSSSLQKGFTHWSAHQLAVRNLPMYVGWQEVKDIFKQFGACQHVKMVGDRAAIIHMTNDDAAAEAMEALDGSMVFGHTLSVEWRLNRGPNEEEPSPDSGEW